MRSYQGYARLCVLMATILILQPLLYAVRPLPPVHAQTEATPAPSGRGQVVLDGPKGTHVNTFNGNLYYSRTDMDLPGCRGGLSLTFSYNSFQASWPSPFGYGWQFRYSIFYFEDEQSGDVTIVWGDGGQEYFVHQGGGTFLAPTGSQDTLIRTQVLPERKYELTTGDRVTYYFDAARHRRVTKIEQSNGSALLFGYDGEGKLTTMTDAYGRQLQLVYADGYLTSVTNANVTPPRVVQYGYDAAANLTSVADPMGFTTSYEYDENHTLTKVTDAENNNVAIGYAGDRVAGLSTALSTVYFSYDDLEDGSSQTTVMEMVGEEGLKTTYHYDDRGRVASVTDPLGAVTRNSWDDQDNLIAVTDPLSRTTRYGYDERGNQIRVTDALSQTTWYTYHPTLDLPVAVTDARGNTGYWEYDEYGNVTRMTDPLGENTVYAYDDCGCHLVAVTDPLSNTTQYDYDQWGNLAVITNALGYTTTLTYNAAGELLARTDANGHTTAFEYDTDGRLLSATDPLTRTVRQAYNAVGNLTQVIDPLDNGLTYEYDELGRLVRVLDAMNGLTEYGYDAQGNLVAVTDANQNTTQFAYDALGRPVQERDPLDNTWRYEYDLAGNLIRRTDANGATTSYSYDELDRLVLIDYPDDSDVTYRYDSNDNVIFEANANVEVSYVYDELDRLVTKTVHVLDPGFTKTIGYTYDGAGRRETMVDPDAGVTTYKYDDVGQLITLANPLAEVSSFDYDPVGQRLRKSLANGTYTAYQYDDAGQLTLLGTYRSGEEVIAGFAYLYDEAGNPLQKVEADGAVETYRYDSLYRLVEASYPGGGYERFAYDAVGNRLRKENSEGTIEYSYDDASRLLTAGDTSYHWDRNGSLVAWDTLTGTATLEHDYENRLVQIALPDGSTRSYDYYPGGLRVRAEEGSMAGVYLYDGFNLLSELDASGGTRTRYTHSFLFDEWLSTYTLGSSAWFHQDGIGSIIAVSDPSQAVSASYAFSAFGETREQIGYGSTWIRFTGRELDPSRLYYYRARYYDPSVGRFVTRDALFGLLIQPSSQNRYAYVLNRPTSLSDPLGLWGFETHYVATLSLGILAGCGSQSRQLAALNQAVDEEWRYASVNYATGYSWHFTDVTVTEQRLQEAVDTGDIVYFGHLMHTYQDYFAHRPYTRGNPDAEGVFGSPLGHGPASAKAKLDRLLGKTVPMPDEPASNPEMYEETLRGSYDWLREFCQRQEGYKDPARCPEGEHMEIIYGTTPPADCIHILGIADACYVCVPGAEEEPGNEPRPPDDNHSVASPLTQAEAPALRTSPRVAILWDGFAQEAGDLLNGLGESYAIAGLDFLPDIVEQTPILVIPSAGLHGQENSSIFRAKLAEFAARGGTIIAFTQPRGSQFAALPGGQVSGYGYNEDVSCFSNAMYVAEYHPALSGLGQCSVTAHVDGYLSTWPEDGKLLLARTKNTAGGLVLYPYGDGWVAVTGMYDDWGAGNWQASAEAKTVIRDLISWGVDPAGLSATEYQPGNPVSVDTPLYNGTDTTAHSVRLTLVSPAREMVSESSQAINLPPGEASTIPFATTAATPLGIWWVDYTLLDAASQVIQSRAAGARFVVSQPPVECGPQDAILLSVTAPMWTVLQGQPASFTAHVVNSTAEPITVTVAAERNHEGSVVLGTVGFQPGEGRDFPYEMTFNSRSALWTYVCANPTCGWNSGRNWLAVEHNAVSVASPSVMVDAQTDQPTYRAGGTVALTSTLHNLADAEYVAYSNVQVFNPKHELVYEHSSPQLLTPNGEAQVVESFVLPGTPVYGFHTARVEVTTEGEVVGIGTAHFEMPAASLYIDALEPDLYLPGQTNTVGFAIQNVGGDDVKDGELTVTLLDPTGVERWSQTQTVNISQTETITPYFDVEFPVGLGEYTLTCLVAFGGQSAWAEVEVPATHRVDVVSHEVKYSGGDALAFDVWIANTGRFQENNLAVSTNVPATAYSRVDSAALAPGERISLTHSVTLPLTIFGGVYPIEVELTQGEGTEQFEGQFVVLPAFLDLDLIEEPWAAGGKLRVQMTNTGGGFTDYEGELRLRDLWGHRTAVEPVSGTLQVGQTTVLTVPIPLGAADASYHLSAQVRALDTGNSFTLNRMMEIEGLSAAMRAFTEQDTYHVTDPITTTAVFTNTGDFPIDDAPASLWVIPMGGTGSITGTITDLDLTPVPAAAVTLDGGPPVYSTYSGQFRIERIVIGTHQLDVRRPGFHLYSDQVFVSGPDTPVQVFVVPAAHGQISGTLRLSGTEEIVVGAKVTLEPVEVLAAEARPLQVRSLWDGTYAVPKVPVGDYRLVVQVLGQSPYFAELAINEGLNLVNIWLGDGGRLQLEHTVVLSDSSPLKRDTTHRMGRPSPR